MRGGGGGGGGGNRGGEVIEKEEGGVKRDHVIFIRISIRVTMYHTSCNGQQNPNNTALHLVP
jgi:hypothetical protein